MHFEQVVRRLINLEEQQYSLPSGIEPYKAKCQSRFNNPEIIAVLGDVVRRLRLLRGTRAAIGRMGLLRRPQDLGLCLVCGSHGGDAHCWAEGVHTLCCC